MNSFSIEILIHFINLSIAVVRIIRTMLLSERTPALATRPKATTGRAPASGSSGFQVNKLQILEPHSVQLPGYELNFPYSRLGMPTRVRAFGEFCDLPILRRGH